MKSRHMLMRYYGLHEKLVFTEEDIYVANAITSFARKQTVTLCISCEKVLSNMGHFVD